MDDYDRDTNTLAIHRNVTTIHGAYVEGDPKTQAGKRTIVLPGFVIDGLKAWRPAQLAHAWRRSIVAGQRPDHHAFRRGKPGAPHRVFSLQRHLWRGWSPQNEVARPETLARLFFVVSGAALASGLRPAGPRIDGGNGRDLQPRNGWCRLRRGHGD